MAVWTLIQRQQTFITPRLPPACRHLLAWAYHHPTIVGSEFYRPAGKLVAASPTRWN